jgi:hypothetical protein
MKELKHRGEFDNDCNGDNTMCDRPCDQPRSGVGSKSFSFDGGPQEQSLIILEVAAYIHFDRTSATGMCAGQ